MATRQGRSAAERVNLHIENTSELDDVFATTPAILKAALKPYPDVAKRLKITIGRDGDVLPKVIAKADVVFAWDFDRRDLGQRAPHLKWVHAHGAGVSHLMPLDWLPNGAVLTNSSGVHGERASEYLLMALLMLNNRVPQMTTSQRQRRWRQEFNTGIAGKTLLIVGVGSVGGGAAKWAKRLGLTVLGIRRSGRPHRHVDRMYKTSALRDLLPKADFVLVTAPHTRETDRLIGAREIALLKPGAGFVNYSRAKLVDYDALRRRLLIGDICAVLDVFSPEPLPRSSPLWLSPNLIITPHCSSDDTAQYTPRTLDLIFRNMRRFLAGKPLMNRVSGERGY